MNNDDVHRKIDGIALAVMMADHNHITVSPELSRALDDIGVMMLGQIKRELKVDTATMNDMLFKFRDQVIAQHGAALWPQTR